MDTDFASVTVPQSTVGPGRGRGPGRSSTRRMQTMIRSMASARARSIVIVMSVRSVDYEMPEMRAACSNAAQSKVTRRHSIALAAGAGGGVSTQHGRPPLSVAVAAAASFSFPSLLLRASFTVSGLKTSSPSPPPSFRFRNGFTGAKGRGRQGGRQRASGRQGRRRQGSSV